MARLITRNVSSMLTLTLTVLTLACNQPADRMVASPTGVFVSGLEIVGSTSIAPGQPVQLGVRVRMADGTVKNTTELGTVTWRTSDAAVASVDQTGLVTAVASQGDAVISVEARLGNTTRAGSREVIVLPAGTFRLVGVIGEVSFPGMVVPGARVEVESGSPFAITNGLGQYRLYGVPPAAEIRVSANGYETKTFSVSLSGNATRNFEVPLSEPRLPLDGSYSVFIDAVTCPSPGFVPALSSDLQHRVYGAHMTQNGTQIHVKLQGDQFRKNSLNKGDHFIGTVIGGGARFNLDWYDSYYYPWYGPESYPSIAERLPSGNYLVSSGQVNVTGSTTAGFTGTFGFSAMTLWDSNFPASNSKLLAACYDGSRMLKILPR